MAIAAQVSHRHWPEAPQPAVRVGDVVMRDVNYPRHAGVRRYFWLLHYGAQLIYEPFGWTGSWYIDIVAFTRGRSNGMEMVSVEDRYVDIVVDQNGPGYRLLDLDELADAFEGGRLSGAQTATAMRDTQRFLEAYLHRGAPFPPPQLVAWFAADHCYPRLPDPA